MIDTWDWLAIGQERVSQCLKIAALNTFRRGHVSSMFVYSVCAEQIVLIFLLYCVPVALLLCFNRRQSVPLCFCCAAGEKKKPVKPATGTPSPKLNGRFWCRTTFSFLLLAWFVSVVQWTQLLPTLLSSASTVSFLSCPCWFYCTALQHSCK